MSCLGTGGRRTGLPTWATLACGLFRAEGTQTQRTLPQEPQRAASGLRRRTPGSALCPAASARATVVGTVLKEPAGPSAPPRPPRLLAEVKGSSCSEPRGAQGVAGKVRPASRTPGTPPTAKTPEKEGGGRKEREKPVSSATTSRPAATITSELPCPHAAPVCAPRAAHPTGGWVRGRAAGQTPPRVSTEER